MKRCIILFLVIPMLPIGCGRNGTNPSPVASLPVDWKAKLHGNWVAIDGRFKGQHADTPNAREFFKEFKLNFDGESFTVESSRSKTQGTFKVNTSALPMQLNMLRNDGKEVAAIFKIKNGRLWFCATEPGDSAPTDFKTNPDSSALVLICERVD